MESIRDLKRRFKRKLVREFNRIGPDEMRGALDKAVGDKADILFVHSSLSTLGRFTAGIEDVLAALRAVSGTMGLPTHTYNYPAELGEPGPVFDPVTTPSQNGLLTETFRIQPGVTRSIQSTHSLAMTGPLAEELTEGHYLNDTPCGVGTPYSRMIEREASALLWGVNFHSYTFFHTAEDAAGSAFAYEAETRDRLRVVDGFGQVQERLSRRQTRDPRRFAECGDLMERLGLARRVQLGAGALISVPNCAKVHDFLVERLRRTPDFLFRACDKPLV